MTGTSPNYRLREGGVGYQFENGVIIRMDSQFVHAEITKKALSLLSSEQFSGAEEEFLSAHKHYRHGEHKDAIVDAGASFESTMKSICDTFQWKYEKGARASDLIKVLRSTNFFQTTSTNPSINWWPSSSLGFRDSKITREATDKEAYRNESRPTSPHMLFILPRQTSSS